jgi:hypothetical protein
MPTLKLNAITCLRQQDVTGKDEWEVWVDGKKVDNGTIDKGQTVSLSKTVPLTASTAKISIKEVNGKNSKQIGGSVDVDVNNPGRQPLDFKTSGAHYELFYTLTA